MEHDKQIEKLIAEEKNRIMLYRSVFGSEDGKKVLEDLMDKWLWQNSASHASAGNTTGIIHIDAQRQVIRTLHKWLTMDLESYLDAYRKPLEIEKGDPLYVGQSTHGYA